MKEYVAPGSRRRSRKPRHLNLAEKISTVHRVLIKHENHEDIAKELRISKTVVSFLVNKAKKNPDFLEELMHQD